jgi:hypothetical protein
LRLPALEKSAICDRAGFISQKGGFYQVKFRYWINDSTAKRVSDPPQNGKSLIQ